MYKIVDLFCGAGGFSLGFKNANFESVLALDKWEDAIKTYNFNFQGNHGINMDIHDYTNNKIDDLLDKYNIHGIIGGPPCQGFSMVGTRDHKDDRNSLYLEYFRFVNKINPAFFVLENVKGLLNLKDGYFKKDIINRFDEIGFNVTYKVLKASDYQIPQNRERVFFVGLNRKIFGNKKFKFPLGNEEIKISTSNAISDLPNLDDGDDPNQYRNKPVTDYQKRMRKNCDTVYNNDITNHHDKTKKIISIVPDGGDWRDLPEKYFKVRNYKASFKRMNSKLPSKTIDTGHRNYFHYSENRVPTVRENARLQSFPDDFIFKGSKTSQYRQVGNAVPPMLAEAIGKKVYNLLEMINKDTTKVDTESS